MAKNKKSDLDHVFCRAETSSHCCQGALALCSKQHQRGNCGLFVLLLIPPSQFLCSKLEIKLNTIISNNMEKAFPTISILYCIYKHKDTSASAGVLWGLIVRAAWLCDCMHIQHHWMSSCIFTWLPSLVACPASLVFLASLSFIWLRSEQIVGKIHAADHGPGIAYQQLCCSNISRSLLNDQSMAQPIVLNTLHCNLHFSLFCPSVSFLIKEGSLSCISIQSTGCMGPPQVFAPFRMNRRLCACPSKNYEKTRKSTS